MHRLPLLLGMLALAMPVRAQDDEGDDAIRDRKSGLIVKMPAGWSRETAREKGSIKFAGIYDLSKTKYVLFSVETGPAAGFAPEAWLGNEKTAVTKFLKSTDTPWTTEPVLVDGTRATRYTVGGKANAEKDYDLRIRGCGFVKNDVFFKISELSYNRAHEETADALAAMWDAVKFEEANPFAEEEKEEGSGEEEKPAEEGGAEGHGAKEGTQAPQGEPLVIEDKVGGYKVSAEPGWSMERAPMEDEETALRLVLRRALEDGSDVAGFEIWRFRANKADMFTTDEPGDVLIKVINGDVKLFDDIFEQGASKILRPEIDARTRLGDADKSCGYEIRGLRLSEEAQIEEAKKLINRGDTTVKVPEFAPRVVRGRLAMISPYIYVVRCYFRPGLGDDEALVGACTKMADSLEFSSKEGKPPPLDVGEKPLGNTLADPANKADRKMSKVHEYKKGGKVAAALKIDYVLPPGFQDVAKVVDTDAQKIYVVNDEVPILIAAQDENNGWVYISMVALSSKRLGPNQSFDEKKKVYDEWIHNFESLARGAKKAPKKAVDLKIGNLSGDGCELEGKISDFSATETHLVTDEGGWRIEIAIKTRGTGAKTFAKQIDAFRKKFKVSKK